MSSFLSASCGHPLRVSHLSFHSCVRHCLPPARLQPPAPTWQVGRLLPRHGASWIRRVSPAAPPGWVRGRPRLPGSPSIARIACGSSALCRPFQRSPKTVPPQSQQETLHRLRSTVLVQHDAHAVPVQRRCSTTAVLVEDGATDDPHPCRNLRRPAAWMFEARRGDTQGRSDFVACCSEACRPPLGSKEHDMRPQHGSSFPDACVEARLGRTNLHIVAARYHYSSSTAPAQYQCSATIAPVQYPHKARTEAVHHQCGGVAFLPQYQYSMRTLPPQLYHSTRKLPLHCKESLSTVSVQCQSSFSAVPMQYHYSTTTAPVKYKHSTVQTQYQCSTHAVPLQCSTFLN